MTDLAVGRQRALTETVFDPRDTTADDEILIGHERIVLGVLLAPAYGTFAAEEVDSSNLEGRHFYHPAHEHIFEAARKHAGSPDVYMLTLEQLIGRNSPRAMGMLDQTPAIYLSDCVRAADCYDQDAFRRAITRVREAYTRRSGRVMLAEFGRAVDSGDMDAAALTWAALGGLLDEPAGQLAQGAHRNVDLGPYLDGTYKPLAPGVGGCRDDNISLLYPGLWHTLIAPTTSGKSWFALWHCISEIRKGNVVVYAHFEESSPGGTIARIRQLAPDLEPEVIRERFIWLDCTTAWKAGEFAKALPSQFVLLVLDGVNACCGQHGWNVNESEPVGLYRNLFVYPAATRGAAVLSLGHPVKNTERQNERHGYGSTAWLDEVNGVGFRLVPSRETPIGKGNLGHSTLYTVKDREGSVESAGVLDASGKREGWYRIGSFKVDDSPERQNTSAWLNVAMPDESERAAAGPDPIDKLADDIVELLETRPGEVVEGADKLSDRLKAAGVKFANGNLSPALLRLEEAKRVVSVKGPRGRRDVSLPSRGVEPGS